MIKYTVAAEAERSDGAGRREREREEREREILRPPLPPAAIPIVMVLLNIVAERDILERGCEIWGGEEERESAR